MYITPGVVVKLIALHQQSLHVHAPKAVPGQVLCRGFGVFLFYLDRITFMLKHEYLYIYRGFGVFLFYLDRITFMLTYEYFSFIHDETLLDLILLLTHIFIFIQVVWDTLQYLQG